MTRHPDWPERLAAFIESRRHSPFVWGANDCAIFAADCVLEITGTDLAGGIRGLDARDALRLLEREGGVVGVAASKLPAHEFPGMAKRGDVVCVPIDSRDTLGIVVGNGSWCAPGVDGLVFRPMAEVALAFVV